MSNQAPIKKPTVSEELEKLGIDPVTWLYVSKNMFPDIDVGVVLMYLRYCQVRDLDPTKRPVHIVTFSERYRDDHGEWRSRDRCQVLPGVDEARITAHRTGQYVGQYPAELGNNINIYGLDVPEYASVTVTRAVPVKVGKKLTGEVVHSDFTGTVYFVEACGTKWDKKEKRYAPNLMWSKRPRQMLIKSAERLALIKAFPEEIANEPEADDVQGSTIEIDQPKEAPVINRAGDVELDKQEPKAIEHQTDNDLAEMLKPNRPELQPVTIDQPKEEVKEGTDNKTSVPDKPKKTKKPSKKASKEPESKIPVDDPPAPGELDAVPSFAPLNTGPEEPPAYGEPQQAGLDIGGTK